MRRAAIRMAVTGLLVVGGVACGSGANDGTPGTTTTTAPTYTGDATPVPGVGYLQTRCDHGNRLYYQNLGYSSGVLAVAAHDLTCEQPPTDETP